MYYFILTDWRNITVGTSKPEKGMNEPCEGLNENKKKKKETENKRNVAKAREQGRFYDQLKNSCIQEQNSQTKYDNFIQNFSPSTPTDDKNSILNNILKISDAIKFHKTRSVQFFISLGNELVSFKRAIANCAVCEKKDEFDAMACTVCIRKKILQNFYREINQAIGYRKTQIGLFIRFAKLAKMCPKFQQTSLCLTKIKKHLAFLFKIMEQDKAWWQN